MVIALPCLDEKLYSVAMAVIYEREAVQLQSAYYCYGISLLDHFVQHPKPNLLLYLLLIYDRIPYNPYCCHQKKPSIHAVFEVNVGFAGLASYVSVSAYQNSVCNLPLHPAGIVTSAQTLKY